MIVKRIHPYLYTNSTSDCLTELNESNWNEPLSTHEYDKSFYLDYSISHDFPYRYFIQNYILTTDLLYFSLDKVGIIFILFIIDFEII